MRTTIKTEIMEKWPELSEAYHVLKMLSEYKKSHSRKLSNEGKRKLSGYIQQLGEYIIQHKKNRHILVDAAKKSCEGETLDQTEKVLFAKYGMSD